MSILNRYYKRKTIKLECRVVTPMFLGNARQEAEWRATPFKSLLRYWWRVAQHEKSDFNSLLKSESKLFGSAGERDENGGGKSLIVVQVFSKDQAGKLKMPSLTPINHPECESNDPQKDKKVDPLLYLAGMGLMNARDNSLKHSYFAAGANFIWVLDYPQNCEQEVQSVISLINAFGSIGGRCRNGWGSFRIENPLLRDKAKQSHLLDCLTVYWKDGFGKDYPNCLGKDGENLLLWKTKAHGSWDKAMRSLAEAYVGVRAVEVNGNPKLKPGAGNPEERHLLGVPLTNHPVRNWDRHASPLRFVVKQRANRYEGFVQHLPFLFSEKMKFPANKDQNWQISVWQKVHRKFDVLLTRVNKYEEIL